MEYVKDWTAKYLKLAFNIQPDSQFLCFCYDRMILYMFFFFFFLCVLSRNRTKVGEVYLLSYFQWVEKIRGTVTVYLTAQCASP